MEKDEEYRIVDDEGSTPEQSCGRPRHVEVIVAIPKNAMKAPVKTARKKKRPNYRGFIERICDDD